MEPYIIQMSELFLDEVSLTTGVKTTANSFLKVLPEHFSFHSRFHTEIVTNIKYM